MICIPITALTTGAALQDIQQAEQVADILELRIDYLADPDLKKLLTARKKPVIITNRKNDEGGKFPGTEAERIQLLEEAVRLGAEHIDLEWSCGPKVLQHFKELTRETKTRIISSWHNFQETPKNLGELYTSIKSAGADIIKIVTHAKSINDNLKIFDLICRAQEDNQQIIALCMGPQGEISRVLALLLGAYLTFGSLQKGKESAPGQIEAQVLREVYRVCELKDADFRLYGLVGNPVSQSQGILVHNRAFQHMELDDLYANFLVEDVASFMRGFKGYICGLSVTMPHKQKIMDYLPQIDPMARRIGAVNTIVKKKGTLIGYNTDVIGAIQAIEAVTPIADKNVVILGAGGVARAIAYGIVNQRGRLTILNRTFSRAQSLARELFCQAGELEEIQNIEADLLINCTSIGMAPQTEEMPVPESVLRPGMVVFDTVYHPAQTRLLKEARARGCRTISGVDMFVNQAAAQFVLWTGLKAPIEAMRSALNL
jgi:3-dehydroquinate dehydratase/shikimate dehydrogenase